MKRIIRLTESDLHNIVKESVKRLVKEGIYGDKVRRAFRDAKDLKDFDHMRQDAEIEGEDLGELGQIEHPQSNSNFYSHEYANGNLDLDDLEGDVRWHKEELYPENRVISKAINHVLEGKSGIHIKKKNRGKFNALKKRTGKSTEELTHSKNPLTRKRAVFAQNAKKWHHKGGKKKKD